MRQVGPSSRSVLSVMLREARRRKTPGSVSSSSAEGARSKLSFEGYATGEIECLAPDLSPGLRRLLNLRLCAFFRAAICRNSWFSRSIPIAAITTKTTGTSQACALLLCTCWERTVVAGDETFCDSCSSARVFKRTSLQA